MENKYVAQETFGLLTVLDEWKDEKGYRRCECECACGNRKVVYWSNLTSGRTRSCGCLENQNRKRYIDIRGMRFGRLTAINPTEQREEKSVVWKCQCDCGNIAYVGYRSLSRGYAKSCGCIAHEKRDIANQRFGKLVALYPDKPRKNRPAKWVCRCDCGSLCSVTISNLRSGHTKSCGCLRSEEYRTLVEGTCLEVIASQKINRNNRSGVKGVSYYAKTDSWVATIGLRKQRRFLGQFDTVSEAENARKQAEEQLFKPIIERYMPVLGEKMNNT